MTVTISATASGSLTPVTAVNENVVNGDFLILRNRIDTSLVTGDGENEETTWTFFFGEDPNFSSFSKEKSLTSALLTLTLTPKGSDISTDVVFIETLGVIGDKIQDLAVNVKTTIEIELLDKIGYTSDDILGILFGTLYNRIFMRYNDDAIISFAKLELTQ
jgi:hypothetical protein